MPPKKTRTELSISTKADMIKERDGLANLGLNVTKTSMGEKYGVSRQAADNALKSRDGINDLNDKSRKNAKERTRLSDRNMKVVVDALMR
ncbi:hypothetical protein BGX30_001328 [Mortierella sp. GBA39]|nr:hypothetical protein BGX30_001328 [Mortierella sp. GBA39]